MSKPKEKNRIVDVKTKKSVEEYDKIPPFDTAYNDTIGQADSKERI